MYLFQPVVHRGFNAFLNDLHSTMYLFQLSLPSTYYLIKNIYIPPCIYFNCLRIYKHIRNLDIYIPPCIYFNQMRAVTKDGLADLHSTMYLFQLVTAALADKVDKNLHSTMYLFQPADGKTKMKIGEFTFHHVSISTVSCRNLVPWKLLFTFHHVSISTASCYFYTILKEYLHSTMYLFQQARYYLFVALATEFTFHHVSISTAASSLTFFLGE